MMKIIRYNKLVNYINWLKSLQESYRGDEGKDFSLKELKKMFPKGCEEHKETIQYEKELK